MKTQFLLLSGLVLLSACGTADKETRAERKDLTEMVFASGVLEADDQSNVTAQTDGYLVKMNFIEGDLVHPGQLMAVIDNSQNVITSRSAVVLDSIANSNLQPTAPALLQVEANIESAKAKAQLDRVQEERYRRLYDSNSVSRLEYENAQYAAASSSAALTALERQYDNLLVTARQDEITQRSNRDVNRVLRDQNLVRAVFAGRVYEKRRQLGDYVRKGDIIAVTGNPGLIYAKLNVDESNMARLRLGQDVLVRLNTDKSKLYHARLHEIFPSFDAGTQSFLVKAWFTDSLDFRITGTQLEANVVVGEKKNALVIPRGYLDYGNIVTIKGKGTRTIRTGIVSTEWVEVLDGLTDHDALVQNKLR